MSSDDPIRASELVSAAEVKDFWSDPARRQQLFDDINAAAAEHRDSPLNPSHVTEVFEACLAHGEASHPTCTVQGVVHTAHFAMKELDAHKDEIIGMLAQLPKQFMPRDDGGDDGWSFLNACMDRDGNQWTGFHLVIEQLVLLGMGIGRVQWCLPREMWSVLPGGMPYFVVVPK